MVQGRTFAATVLVALTVVPMVLATPQDAQQVIEIRQILREASHLVGNIEESQQASAAANIAGAQARAGDLPGAFATAHSLPKGSDQAMALGSIAWVFAHAGDLPAALLTVSNSEEGASKAIAYSQIAEQLAEAGDFERALGIARMIHHQPGYLVQTLTRIATKQWKSGSRRVADRTFREALEEVERERETNPNPSTSGVPGMFLQIAVAQANVGDRAAALATLDRLHLMVASAEGLGVKEILLQELAMAQAQTGEIQAALQTADEMPPGSQRDFAFQAIAEQQAQQGDLRGALETAAHVHDLTLGPFALRRIAHVQAASGDAAGALETIGSIQGNSARTEALSEVALEQAVNAHPAAIQTLQLAWEAATNAESEVPSHVFEKIAVARGVLGDIAGALEVVARMKNPNSRVWPLWNLTEMMVAAGNARGALGLAESQDTPAPKAYALLGAAQGMLDQIDAEREKHRALN